MIGRANLIAKTEPLTQRTLLKEIFGFTNNTCRLRNKKKYVLRQLKDIVKYGEKNGEDSEYKSFVIYSFIRMWNEEKVYDYNFKEAWLKYRSEIIIRYKVWYNINGIKDIQRSLIVV